MPEYLGIWPYHWNEPRHDKTNKMSVRPAKSKISLGIRPVWPESSLCAQWVAKDPRFLHADSEDSDQTGRMPRLIWVFAGCALFFFFVFFFGFVMSRLKCRFRFFTTRRRSSCTLTVSWTPCEPPHLSHALCRKCSEVSDSTSFEPHHEKTCLCHIRAVWSAPLLFAA